MPRDSLTQEQIVRTAIELLDDEGLDGLNMRSLGKRLDAAPTAMYWHVQNKDNLVRLAGDEVWGEIELPDAGPLGWRAAAESLATGMHTVLSRHPWMVQALASHLMYGPGKSRFDEATLAVYEDAGFTPEEADLAAAAVFTYTLGNVIGAAATVSLKRRLSKGDGNPARRMQETLSAATDIAMAFPRLRARLGQRSADYNEAPDRSFEYGLTNLLDGFAKRLAERAD
ncbi:TetR/AcrR family transcriptional regulator C-terminal domain-containing protein [Nocardia donostiensis]|uniref:TetR family transcriptional regulator n=1 Tax=Nocardia donostiensis TaxID=1538463 RepID=A0A1V2THQ9_9NOCA|nr:TetR/AcrR family transcriptional regulator C-terminal domain-containing protein [Nocardia donostiensis]ONM49032.1 TetR family transcriptional regulator [Nocardia donostiensis]OQS14049.1 TetR family transcriptional regulator [Nocardia donostiensis]OQS19512.1 TetR family transcriptional regulator [Nocardia donostiensis]